MAGPFSSSPAPLVDPDEAGRVWRAGRLEFFRARLAELGLSGDGEGAALLSAVERESTALDALSQDQAASSRPWWADGEYDAARADEANDLGVIKLREAKQHSATSPTSTALLREAAAAFTDAARLAPRRAVYHSNRAAAFLRLNRPAEALSASRDALAADPDMAAARAREARALGALGRWAEAARAWREVLAREPESAAARRSLSEAEARAGGEEALGSRDAARWAAGHRPALAPVSAEAQSQRAERLLDAEQMWWSNPTHLGALAGYVEALLACGRHAEAWERLAEAPPGWEREALRAEALWRGGEVAAALQLLREALQAREKGAEDGWTEASSIAAAQLPFPPPSKIVRLEEMLQALARQCTRVDALERALADADQEDDRAASSSFATELNQLCTILLDALDAVTAPGLAAALLCARATALGELESRGGDGSAALNDWGRGLDLCPGHAPSLRARARYFAQRQRHTDAFLDWRQLAAALPGDGDVEAELERAAKRAARSRPAASGTPGRARAWGPGEEALSALQVLGVGVEATAGQVRAAYLKLAGSWHPDKWATGTEEEQAEADRKFRQVQAAYEEIKSLE